MADIPSVQSVQSLSHVRLFATPWIAARQASLSITSSWSPPEPMSIESVMPSSHLILCHPLLLLPPIPPSIRVFSNKSTLRMRWPKYWSFSFSISLSNEHPELISFRMDWLDLLAVQGTLKRLLQQHSSKASIFWHSAFFTVQLSHLYMTTGNIPYIIIIQICWVSNFSLCENDLEELLKKKIACHTTLFLNLWVWACDSAVRTSSQVMLILPLLVQEPRFKKDWVRVKKKFYMLI